MLKLVGQANKLYIRIYQGKEDYIPNPRKKDNTTITWSLTDEADITLSNLSPHTQYLLSQGRLAIGLSIETTCRRYIKSTCEPQYRCKNTQRYTARIFHPRWTLINETIRIVPRTASSIEDFVISVDPQSVPFGSNKYGYGKIASMSADHRNPYRPYFWARFKVVLLTAPVSNQSVNAGSYRVYHTSEPITIGFANNNE